MTGQSEKPTSRVAHEHLGRLELRGSLATLAAQAVQLLLYTATAIVLARLITPQEYGLFAIAVAITAFLGIAKDGGLIAPVIQSQTLTRSQLDTLFWCGAAGGLLLTLVAFGAAPLAGRLFADERLVPVIRVLGLTLLAGCFSIQHRALLRRQMRFSMLASCDALAAAAGCAVAIFLAMRGAGYWSLVGLYLTTELVQTVLTVLSSGWRPGWPKRGTGIRPLLRFGGIVMAFELIGYLNYRFDNLLVGWFLGTAALGYYDKAYQFLLLPINQIAVPVSGVAQSALSTAQNDIDLYRSSLRRCLLLTTGLGMPLTAFLYANADAIVAIAFGPPWLPAAPVFCALAPAAFLMTITASMGWIFLSLGRAGRQLRWSAFSTAVTVGAFFLGLNWGVVGVALALSISRIVLFLPTLIYTCSGSPVQWTDLLRISARPAFAALASLSVSMAAGRMLGTGTQALAVNALIFAATYVLCWSFIPGGPALLRDSLTFQILSGPREGRQV
jgi:O-antigen/teichoic acid export membrane protein